MMLGFETSDWRIRRNWTWSNRDMAKTCFQFCRAFRTIPRLHTHASINVDTVALQIESAICPRFRRYKSTSGVYPRGPLLLSDNSSIDWRKTWEGSIRHEKETWSVARRGCLITRDICIQPRACLHPWMLTVCTGLSSDVLSPSTNCYRHWLLQGKMPKILNVRT